VTNTRQGAGPAFVVAILLIGALGVGFLSWWLPEQRIKRRGQNERSAIACLRMLARAEADFRANDRDENGVNDFWTGDVAGLYRNRLIDRSIAEADARPIVALTPHPIPKDGYYFMALQFDDSVDRPEEYQQVTDPKSGKVHNLSIFGFVAFPAEYGVTGRPTFIINEGNSTFKCSLDWKWNLHWPSEDDIKRYWGHAG
jgi:hypothetical protein